MALDFTKKRFREQLLFNQIVDSMASFSRVIDLGEVDYLRDGKLPLRALVMGSTDPEAPTLAFFAGVHGLERIGCEVVMAYMQTLSELMKWDQTYRRLFSESRLIFMPIVNPVGVAQNTRSNGFGVDLMRSSPLAGEIEPSWKIYRGHKISPKFPWFQGENSTTYQPEIEAVHNLVQQEMFQSKTALIIDVHSGFGTRDRLWFPYAHSKKPFPHINACIAIKELLSRTHKRHIYKVEPVSHEYTIHGDVWDDLYFKFEKQKKSAEQVFIPWTLEMGSWLWLKKNPMQAFSKVGLFHPVVEHRMARILRRHNTLFDFYHRIAISSDVWKQAAALNSDEYLKYAEKWYSVADLKALNR